MPFDNTRTISKIGQCILNATRLIEDEDKWIQGKRQEGDSFCIMGAIDHTFTELRICGYAVRSVAEAIRAERIITSPDGVYGVVIAFNDAPDTTHEDVMRIMHRAAELA
jgi:hypothetical protein